MVALLTALGLLAATVLIHGIGTTSWLHWLMRHFETGAGESGPRLTMRTIILTAIVLTALHMVEIMVWAIGYLVMVPDEQLNTLEAAFYFSAVTFTTLGYGDITLDSAWRLLSGIQAINGILLVGWSTAFIFAVLQRSWQSELEQAQGQDKSEVDSDRT